MKWEHRLKGEGRPDSLAGFFLSWLAVGVQSFGGGVATLALIRRMAVDQKGWLSEEEFTREWAVCQVAPGINLLALTILLGNRAAGATGILLALAGLLLPTSAITALLTAFYAHIRHAHVVEAALRGIIPATVALGLLTSWQMVRPLLKKSRGEGKGSGLLSLALLAGSALLTALRLPIVSILLAAALMSALFQWRRTSPDAGRDGGGP